MTALSDVALKPRGFPGLDVLRGIAILLVMIAHFIPASFPYELQISVAAGIGGVILFFFLSGFLMDRTLATDRNIFVYAIRRGFRILPMYWMSLILVVVLNPVWSAGTVASNATFTAPLTGAERMSGVYWTLYVEVLFYCAAPLLRYMGERAIAIAPYAFIAAMGAFWIFRGGVNAALFYALFCLAGMQFGAWNRGRLSGRNLVVAMAVVTVASGAFPIVSIYLAAAPAICCVLLWIALRTNLQSKAMQFLGRVSYSWYLIHAVIGFPVRAALAANPWLAALTAALLTLLISVATFMWIERPTIRFGSRLASRFSSAPLRSAVAPV